MAVTVSEKNVFNSIMISLTIIIAQEDTFFSSKFSSFTKCQQHRCGMCLKASDGLWITCLTNDVNSLYSNQHRQH